MTSSPVFCRSSKINEQNASFKPSFVSRSKSRTANQPLTKLSAGSSPTHTGTIPHLVVDLVCDSLLEDMKLQDSYMDFPIPVLGEPPFRAYRPDRLDSDQRQTLKTMSLVHRAWTGFARRALRRRTDVHAADELERFLHSRFCGAWVQEFFYSMLNYTVKDVVRNAPGNTLNTLVKVFERLPNLKALSLAIDNMLYVVGPFRLTTFLSPAPRGLRVLHIYLHQWTDDSLCELRGVVADLHRLHTLSIMGDSFSADADDSQSLRAAESAVPPASLKRVLLRFRTLKKDAIPLLAWLFTPREDYALHELRIRHNTECGSGGVRDAVEALLPILSPVLADLKVLEFHASRVKSDKSCTLLYFPESFQALMDRCTSLEVLYAYVIGPVPLNVPGPLQFLYIFEL